MFIAASTMPAEPPATAQRAVTDLLADVAEVWGVGVGSRTSPFCIVVFAVAMTPRLSQILPRDIKGIPVEIVIESQPVQA